MAKDILQCFKEFRDLSINCSDSDFQASYRSVLKQDNFEDALAYDELRRKKKGKQFEGAFHLVLNVKTNESSDFLPFAYVTNSDKSNDNAKKKAALSIIDSRQKDIKFNFSQLLDILTEARSKEKKESEYAKVAVETISFKTVLNNGKPVLDDNAKVEVDGVNAEDDQKRIIRDCIQDDNSFVSILSTEYHEKSIADELYYNVVSFDFDAKSGKKLTQFLLISENADECEYFTQVRGRTLRDIVSIIRTKYIYDIAQRNKYESIKSAVAAIMSRNMSHNLGSHYLYYTKSSLETLAAGVRNNGPHVRGAAKVLSYIQGRMDYLATLVANDKYPYGSVNFKSQIWDELTIDDFSMRHYGNHPNLDFKANLTKSIKAAERIQKKAEKLSTLLSNCEGITEEELELKRKSIEGEVGEIYRQVTAIDQNSSYKRTTNYLLANLIRSENYSRPDVISRKNEYRPLFLFVRLWDDNKEEYKLFTGSNDLSIMESENDVKDSLSKINLALPGGTMSCHAFYNILENFIRNSAKYSWTDDAREELTFTVALRVNRNENSVTCTIFDNKHDALRSRDEFHKRTLLEDLQMRLRHHTKVLGANYSVDKENKGLKEMLFSAIWLKANESNDPFANIVAKIEDTPPRRKLEVIKKHAFEFISVDDNGEVSNDTERGNLALRIILPLFTQVEALDALRIKNLKELVKLHTDVVEVPKTILSMRSNLPRPYVQIFPRLYFASDSVLDETIDNQRPFNLVKFGVDGVDAHMDYRVPSYKLLESINENLGDINQYWLRIGSFQEPGFDSKTPHSQQVYFSTHLSTKSQKKDILGLMGEYAYVDTISGNNFTKTLEGLFSSGLFPDGYYRSYVDLYLAFKIKESALTRITIVDERLFNSIRWNVDVKDKRKGDEQRIDIRNTAVELSMKNIRVLNFLDKARPGAKEVAAKLVDGFPYFYGNKFYSTGPYADSANATNFLSIHLGLIEKLLKSKKLEGLLGPVGLNPYANNRIERLMKELKRTFGYGTDKKVHISIHSGRGNFSQELEGPLKEYPFISLASLENAFNNSKYLLSQLFYNTTYIGKGEVNH